MSALYWRLTQPAVRRALSLQDGNPASATFGCCDRSFWHYRTVSSFPAATMQQLALPFAMLFATPFPGNEWYHDAEMLDRARAAMLFWARAQHPCGAVDEWYPRHCRMRTGDGHHSAGEHTTRHRPAHVLRSTDRTVHIDLL